MTYWQGRALENALATKSVLVLSTMIRALDIVLVMGAPVLSVSPRATGIWLAGITMLLFRMSHVEVTRLVTKIPASLVQPLAMRTLPVLGIRIIFHLIHATV